MALHARVTGAAGRDNALYVRIDGGQHIERLLFDCGAGVAETLGRAETQQIDGLFFSHLHMDHIAGFDGFFRTVYSRTTKPNRIYGPPGSAAILQHRMQGFLWNLEAGAPGAWDVFEIWPEAILGWRLLLGEAFAVTHPLPKQPRTSSLVAAGHGYQVEAIALDHATVSLAYRVREQPRSQIDTEQLAALGLHPGPWLQTLKTPAPGMQALEIGGRRYELAALREALLRVIPGESVAYCTDFRLTPESLPELARQLHGCTTLFCESQYMATDAELAARNFHMTAPKAAELARQARTRELVLIHVSDRYQQPALNAMLAEAQAIFPNTRFPANWNTPAS